MNGAGILLVEDERIVALDIQGRLRRLGYSVTGTATTGEGALRAAVAWRPDLALVDILLEGAMDGIELARRLRDEFRLPVVFLTANADPATVERAKKTEPFGYLIKPFDEKELATTIELALHNHGMEVKLRESEEKLSAILRCIGDGVIATDRDGMIRFLNPVAEETTGCTATDALGRPVAEIFSVTDEQSGAFLEDPAHRTIRDREPITLRGAVHRTSRGERRILDLNAWPIGGDDGEPVGAVLAFHDITELKLAQKRLEEQARELTRSNEDLEQFAYIASHDLQAPLRAVTGYAELLSRRYQGRLDTSADEFISRILDGTERMRKFIEDLLAYSRVPARAKEWELVDCSEILKVVLRNLAPQIEQSGATVTHDQLPTVPGDSTQLLQLFQNLLANALKYSGQTPPVVHVSVARDGADWEFSVRDNGIGVAPAEQERIFMLFQRGRGGLARQGAGIGLAVAKRIVESHHGSIGVHSQPGEGADFWFRLPATKEKSVAR